MMMSDDDLETCLLGGQIYLKCFFKDLNRVCPALQSIKEQLKGLLLEGEGRLIGDVDIQLRRGALMWAMFMSGNLSLDEEEQTWFAERVAKLTDIEERLRQPFLGDALRVEESQLEMHTTPTQRCLARSGLKR